MSKHTAGPWVEFSDQQYTIAIMPAGRDGDICAFAVPYPTRENARLIAAAPDLLEACHGLLAEWEKLSRYGSPLAKAANERVNAARTAIAKAAGDPQ